MFYDALHSFSGIYVLLFFSKQNSIQRCHHYSLPPLTHLRDVIDRPHGREGEHAEPPAGDETHHHAATQQQDVAEQRTQHVSAGRNLEDINEYDRLARLEAACK